MNPKMLFPKPPVRPVKREKKGTPNATAETAIATNVRNILRFHISSEKIQCEEDEDTAT